MCRADLTERAVEEKDMLVLAKEEENIVVNKPACHRSGRSVNLQH